MSASKKHGFFFKDWVEFYGRRRLASDLGVTHYACAKWAQGKGYPEVKHMKVIVNKLAPGVVEYKHMIEGTEIKTASLA